LPLSFFHFPSPLFRGMAGKKGRSPTNLLGDAAHRKAELTTIVAARAQVATVEVQHVAIPATVRRRRPVVPVGTPMVRRATAIPVAYGRKYLVNRSTLGQSNITRTTRCPCIVSRTDVTRRRSTGVTNECVVLSCSRQTERTCRK
jgi:hypothetical protein